MRAGRLRHRLVLQSRQDTRDAYGASIPGWLTETTVWGSIEPLSGREWLAQQQIQSEVAVRIVIRYNGSIDTSWRVKNDGLYYDIENVINENNRDRMLTLMCRQGVSEDYGDEDVSGAVADDLLLETGDFFLIETGDNLLLEA